MKGSQCWKDTPNTAEGSTREASPARSAPHWKLHMFQVLRKSTRMARSRPCRQRESALVGFVKRLSKPLLWTFNRGETIGTVVGCASDLTSSDNVHWQFQRGPAAEEHPEIGYRRQSNGTPFQHAYIKRKNTWWHVSSAVHLSTHLRSAHFRNESLIFLHQILPLTPRMEGCHGFSEQGDNQKQQENVGTFPLNYDLNERLSQFKVQCFLPNSK